MILAQYDAAGRLGNCASGGYLMGMANTALLEDRGVVSVSGPEAKGFLQGLLTNDVAKCPDGGALYAALLTPQGKILFDFLVVARGQAFLLDCTAGTREALQKRLTLYRLRAKVEIAPRDDLAIAAAWNGASLPGGFDDPRLAALGRRAIVPAAGAKGGDGDYLDHRLDLGVPEGADFGQDRMFALDAGLDALNGVAFDKGCYVGQELTARMKHRSTARKRLLPIEGIQGAPLPEAQTAIRAGGKELGQISSRYGARGFATIRLDRLDEAGDAAVDAGGVAIAIQKPGWLFSSS